MNNYGNDYSMGTTPSSDELFREITERDMPVLKNMENELRSMTEDRKKNALFDQGLIPKFKDIDEKNSVRCPVYRCFKVLNGVSALNSHIARNHKELEGMEIKFLPSGEIKYPNWMIDHVWRYFFL